MSFEITPVDNFKNLVGEATDYHTTIFNNGKLWKFSRKFVDQPAFNWGHRVHFALSPTTLKRRNSRRASSIFKVPAITSEENEYEIIFTHDGHIYLLLTNAFGEPAFSSLHRWNENSWETVIEFQPPYAGESRSHIYWAIADGNNKGDKIIIGDLQKFQVYRLKIDGTSSSIDLEHTVAKESYFTSACPLGGIVTGDTLFISFGVHGCGFRWENNRFIKVHLVTKETEEVQ
ncbi:hypothetical protein PENTCL1PPCAC_29122, partial [Pristionchus entomophagus]